MWGRKKETELEKTKREVERRRRMAEEQGLDRLLLDVYHQSVRYYPAWIKNPAERKYVYPAISSATENVVKDPAGDTYITEFALRGAKYKIVSERRGNLLTRDVYYVMDLFLNGERVFSITEKHDIRLEGEHYYTLTIGAYINDDWVNDFRGIREFQRRVVVENAEVPVEDRKRIEELRKNFNLRGSRVIRVRPWPHYKIYRLALLLVILFLALTLLFEFMTLLP